MGHLAPNFRAKNRSSHLERGYWNVSFLLFSSSFCTDSYASCFSQFNSFLKQSQEAKPHSDRQEDGAWRQQFPTSAQWYSSHPVRIKGWLEMASLIPLVESKSLSRVRLFGTPWTVAHQVPLSMGFSGQKHWSREPFPSSGDLPT